MCLDRGANTTTDCRGKVYGSGRDDGEDYGDDTIINTTNECSFRPLSVLGYHDLRIYPTMSVPP